MRQSFGDQPIGACIGCGQQVRLPTALDGQVACPRCGRVARAIDLIPQATPVAAVPVNAVPCDPSAPTILQMPAFTQDDIGTTPPSRSTEPQPRVIEVSHPLQSSQETKEPQYHVGQSSRLLNFCAALDAHLVGRRLKVVSVLVFLAGVGGPVLDSFFSGSKPIWTVISTNLLLVVLWVLVFAWLGGLRNDDGVWNGGLFLRRLGTHVADLKEAASDLTWASLGSLLVALGSAILALRNIGTVVAVAFDNPGILVGFANNLLAIGTISFTLGVILLLRRSFRRTRATSTAIQIATSAIGKLPPVIDMQECRTVQFGGNDPVQVTLSALARWYQRKTAVYDDEYGYQIALERHFQRYAKELPVRREVWMGKNRKEGIADIVLGGIVLIEVKHHFSKTRADRAIGQMKGYAQTWKGRPKLLVIFDANRADVFESLATQDLRELNERHQTITVRM